MQDGPSIEDIDAEIKAYFQRALNWSLEYTEVFMDDPTLDADAEAAGMPDLMGTIKPSSSPASSVKPCRAMQATFWPPYSPSEARPI